MIRINLIEPEVEYTFLTRLVAKLFLGGVLFAVGGTAKVIALSMGWV